MLNGNVVIAGINGKDYLHMPVVNALHAVLAEVGMFM